MVARWFSVLVDTGAIAFPLCVVSPDIGGALEVAQKRFPNALRFDARLASFLNGMGTVPCEWQCIFCDSPCIASDLTSQSAV